MTPVESPSGCFWRSNSTPVRFPEPTGQAGQGSLEVETSILELREKPGGLECLICGKEYGGMDGMVREMRLDLPATLSLARRAGEIGRERR